MEFINQILDGLQFIIDWFQTGIYTFFEELLKEAVAWLVIAKIKFQIWALTFSWEVAKTIMFNLNIGSYIQSAYATLDPTLMGYLNYFRVPESLNLITQALITRLTLNVTGW